jgi:hypothetical protein
MNTQWFQIVGKMAIAGLLFWACPALIEAASDRCVRRSESAALIGQKVQRSGLEKSIVIGLGVC